MAEIVRKGADQTNQVAHCLESNRGGAGHTMYDVI